MKKSRFSLRLHSFTLSSLNVMQFNAIACQCDDYWTLNNLSLLSYMLRSYFLDIFLLYFILLEWEPIMMIVQVFQSFFMLHAFFSNRKGRIFTLSLFFTLQNFLLITHNSRKNTYTCSCGCTNTQTQISNEFLHFFIFTSLVHEEFYILSGLCAFSKYFSLSILSTINFLCIHHRLKLWGIKYLFNFIEFMLENFLNFSKNHFYSFIHGSIKNVRLFWLTIDSRLRSRERMRVREANVKY